MKPYMIDYVDQRGVSHQFLVGSLDEARILAERWVGDSNGSIRIYSLEETVYRP
jgi:hypothetical protein